MLNTLALALLFAGMFWLGYRAGRYSATESAGRPIDFDPASSTYDDPATFEPTILPRTFQERFPCTGCGSTTWRWTVRTGVRRVLACSDCPAGAK